mgnify:FL=1|jgi:hypothetical protein
MMVDSDHPSLLRGSLQALHAQREQWNFRDEVELLQLLKHLNVANSEQDYKKE